MIFRLMTSAAPLFCELLDAGIDIVTVQQLAGHASPEQTSKYDRRKEETKRCAVQVLDLLCL